MYDWYALLYCIVSLLTGVITGWFDAVVTVVTFHAVSTRQHRAIRRTLCVWLQTLAGPRAIYCRASNVCVIGDQATRLTIITFIICGQLPPNVIILYVCLCTWLAQVQFCCDRWLTMLLALMLWRKNRGGHGIQPSWKTLAKMCPSARAFDARLSSELSPALMMGASSFDYRSGFGARKRAQGQNRTICGKVMTS